MHVVIDCDTGNDDSWAIITVLRSEEKFNFKLVGITCTEGNSKVDNAAKNTLMTLKTCDRLDIPVFKGARSSLIAKENVPVGFHGEDGLNNVYSEDEKPSDELVQKSHAVEALKNFIDLYPNDLTILSLAPLTNIALLYKLYPEISSKIKALYVMGGNHLGVGNTTSHAEFNFWFDPEAAHIVMKESKCEIIVFPWEPCMSTSESIPFDDWRINVLSSNGNNFTKFLDPVEKIAYKKYKTWMPCDLFLAVCFILPSIITRMEEHYITVELGGFHCRAMMVIDHLKDNKPNAKIIKEIDDELFKKFMLWICNHPVKPELEKLFANTCVLNK